MISPEALGGFKELLFGRTSRLRHDAGEWVGCVGVDSLREF